MTEYKSIDHRHQCAVDQEAEKEALMGEFVLEILSNGEAEFADIKYTVEDDLLFRVQNMEDKFSDALAGFTKEVHSREFKAAHEQYLELLRLAAYQLADELFSGVEG